jgi:O-antigen/teichoic acid export membrane protein
MGAYSLADDIAAMPTTELLMPMNRVLFPALVKVSHERTEFKRLYLLAQSIHALIGIPAGIGLVLVAPEVVTWLLGEKWLIAIPFVQVLALLGIVNAIVSSQLYVLLTLGNVRLLALLSTSQVVLFGGLAVFLIPGGGALEISWLRLLVSLAGSALYALAILRHLDNLRLSEVLKAFVRPIVAGAIMAVCVWQFGAMVVASSFFMLLFKVALGVVIYPLVIAALWFISGRPAGAETYVIGTIQALLSTRSSSRKGDGGRRVRQKP